MHFSEKNRVDPLSSAGTENADFGSHCPAKFRPILNWFIPNDKLKYEDSENRKKRLCKYSHFELTSNQTEELY